MTARQKEVLAVIAARQRQAGPTLNEVAQVLGVWPNAVKNVVNGLRAQGKLTPDGRNGLVLAPKRP